jgi:hypothetical protein
MITEPLSWASFSVGAITMACLTLGLLFLRFWKSTGDKLLLSFSIVFWLLALERLVLAVLQLPGEWRGYVYLIRLAAFLFLLVGIIQKNRASTSDSTH